MKENNRERIFHGITNIDEDIIEEAMDTELGNKRKLWMKWGAVAACLCLAGTVAGGVWIREYHGSWGEQREEISLQKREIAGMDKKIEEDREKISPGPTEEGKETETEKKRRGISIAPIELPKGSDTANSSVSYDMSGCLVYKGKVYTQAEFYEGEEMERVSATVGEKLGTAKGTIDEWSSQKEYEKEFASTYSGDVHRVKGYDEDFRLCCIEKFQEDGEERKFIIFLECLNGIDLIWGKDLFEKRLHMKENIQRVQYQKLQDVDEGKEKYYDFHELSETSLDAFVDALYQGEFEDVSQSNPEFEEKLRNIDTDEWKQAGLKVLMQDGTIVKLWIYENGYVKYTGMQGGVYFLKLAKKALVPILSQCN